MKRLIKAWKLFCRRRKHPLDDRYLSPEARVVVARKITKHYIRAAWIWKAAFVTALIAAFTLNQLRIDARTDAERQLALRDQMTETMLRQDKRHGQFMDRIDSALTAIPISIHALEADRLIEAQVAGSNEARRIRLEKDLSSCWTQYDRLNNRLESLTGEVNGYRQAIEGRKNSWSIDVDARSK